MEERKRLEIAEQIPVTGYDKQGPTCGYGRAASHFYGLFCLSLSDSIGQAPTLFLCSLERLCIFVSRYAPPSGCYAAPTKYCQAQFWVEFRVTPPSDLNVVMKTGLAFLPSWAFMPFSLRVTCTGIGLFATLQQQNSFKPFLGRVQIHSSPEWPKGCNWNGGSPPTLAAV